MKAMTRRKKSKGTVYLIHIGCAAPGRPPKAWKGNGLGKKCFHYIGYTTRDVNRRIAEHLKCHPSGAAIVKNAIQLGLKVKVTRLWENVNGNLELYIKGTKRVKDFCPCCNKNPRQVREDWERKMREKHDKYWLKKKGILDNRY